MQANCVLGLNVSLYHVTGGFGFFLEWNYVSEGRFIHFCKSDTPLSFVPGGIRTHNLLIFGQISKPSCLGPRQEENCLPKLSISIGSGDSLHLTGSLSLFLSLSLSLYVSWHN